MQKKLTYDILSLNVRGIREQSKRRSIFSYLKDQKSKFCFLQETYSDLNDENIWRNEWGGEIFFSHGRFFIQAIVDGNTQHVSFDRASKQREVMHYSSLE